METCCMVKSRVEDSLNTSMELLWPPQRLSLLLVSSPLRNAGREAGLGVYFDPGASMLLPEAL